MDENKKEMIMDKMTKICLCKGITRLTIKNAIKSGAKSVAEVQKSTGAGSGPCKGRRCTEKIRQLIDDHNDQIF